MTINRREGNSMKKFLYAAAMSAAMIGVAAPPAHSKTQKQRISALEKTVKKQAKLLKALTAIALDGQARGADAQAGYSFLIGCMQAQPAGGADMLDAATSVSFVQGDATLGLPDAFSWLPAYRTVIVPEGEFYMTLLDPDCVVAPTAARSTARGGWHPFKVVLR